MNDRFDITNKVICVFNEIQDLIIKLTKSQRTIDEITKDKDRLQTKKKNQYIISKERRINYK